MRTLLIYSHPNHESLNAAFLEAVKNGIGNSSSVHEVALLDLYEEKFDPAVVFNKDRRRRHMYMDPAYEKYRNLIMWADRMVFIYPIFWGRPPAMLLGFFDQIFAANFAYKYVPWKLYPEGLLTGKSVVCISTMRSPVYSQRLLLRNANRIIMKRAVFNFVGIRKVKFFEFGCMENPIGNQGRKLSKVEQYFSNH